MDRLHLNAEDITIQPVHPSIIGQDTWFQITYSSSGTTRYFSCQNARERDEWISSLKKTLMLTEDRRRTDNSLKERLLCQLIRFHVVVDFNSVQQQRQNAVSH